MKLPSDFNPERLVALIDTREQLPYVLHPLRTQAATLEAGDYSVLGCEHSIAIERKSLADFVACCGGERERFQRELHRLRGYAHRAVIIEATAADLEAGAWMQHKDYQTTQRYISMARQLNPAVATLFVPTMEVEGFRKVGG